MTKVSWRSVAVGLGCSLLGTSAFAQNPTIEIKAVKLNPTCAGGSRNGLDCVLAPDCPGGICAPDAPHGDISPTNTLNNVSPGDIIVADVLARDYSPANDRLLAFQFDVADSFDASVRGGVSLLQAPRRCATKADCSFISLSAECVTGVCASNPPIDPRAGGVNVDFSRFDFVFFSSSGFLVLFDLSRAVELRLAIALTGAGDSVVYPGSPRYLGTISFQVGSDMCGTAEIRLDPVPDTVLTRKDGTFILPLDLPPLTLIGPSVQACKCLNIVDSDPPSCLIEARQPFNPDGSGAVNINSMRLKLDCPDASSVTSPESFLVRELRAGGFGNLVNSVVVDPTDKRWVTVTFRRNLKAERWTCTSFSGGSGEVCLGLLAADVNSDSLVDEMDIEDLAATRPLGGPLTSCLRDTGSCTLRQCDADRSQRCTPADILRVVDIINGGGSFATLGADMGIVTLGGAPIPCPSLP